MNLYRLTHPKSKEIALLMVMSLNLLIILSLSAVFYMVMDCFL